MTTPDYPHPRIPLSDIGDMIAAIPHVLGFHPRDSLVAVGLHDHCTLRVALRIDLPAADDRRDAAEYLVRPLRMQEVCTRRGHSTHTGPQPPQRPLIQICEEGFTGAGSPCRTACEPRCYEDIDCAGQVPDPSTSPLAAAAVTAGAVTFDRRDDMIADLAPVADDVLARRASLLAGPADTAPAVATGRRRLRVVQTAVDRAARGELPGTDDDIVELAAALSDHYVRDVLLVPVIPIVPRRRNGCAEHASTQARRQLT